MGIEYGVANASAGCNGNSINLAAAYAVSQALLRQQQQPLQPQAIAQKPSMLQQYQNTAHQIVTQRPIIPSLLSLGVTNPNAPPGDANPTSAVTKKNPLLPIVPGVLCGTAAATSAAAVASSLLPLLPPTTTVSGLAAAPGANSLNNFTTPSILASARYTEQMQKRKLLWGNKKTQAAASGAAGAGGTASTVVVVGGGPSGSNGATTSASSAATAASSSSTPAPLTNNKWEETRFSQDTDGKVATKFLRLMGMKDATPKPSEVATGTAPSSASAVDTISKQNELFSTMEHQYEVARQVTHTMRGMGLGFGSQPRQF